MSEAPRESDLYQEAHERCHGEEACTLQGDLQARPRRHLPCRLLQASNAVTILPRVSLWMLLTDHLYPVGDVPVVPGLLPVAGGQGRAGVRWGAAAGNREYISVCVCEDGLWWSICKTGHAAPSPAALYHLYPVLGATIQAVRPSSRGPVTLIVLTATMGLG